MGRVGGKAEMGTEESLCCIRRKISEFSDRFRFTFVYVFLESVCEVPIGGVSFGCYIR
jgi:hypothetical protein